MGQGPHVAHQDGTGCQFLLIYYEFFKKLWGFLRDSQICRYGKFVAVLAPLFSKVP